MTGTTHPSEDDATEERSVQVVDGRTYVECPECGGWYEKRGVRLHSSSCDGEVEPGRETPPEPESKKRERAEGEQVLSISDEPVVVCPGCGSDNVVDADRAAHAFEQQIGRVPAQLERYSLYCNSCNRAFDETEA